MRLLTLNELSRNSNDHHDNIKGLVSITESVTLLSACHNTCSDNKHVNLESELADDHLILLW